MLRIPALLLLSVLLSVLLGALGGCDNVGRAFDPVLDPPPVTPDESSPVQVLPEGGDARSGRPLVKAVFPEGGGWPTTVPIVVEFNESLNAPSILPTSANANDALVFVRAKGSPQRLPALYDFVANDRVLVIRPTSLTNEGNPTYEIVMLPDGRDADGVRFSVPAEGEVLAEFQANQSETIADGRILTTFPRDNQSDASREGSYYVFFDRPANISTITTTSFVVRPVGGSALPGDIEAPLGILNNDDSRIVRFTPDDPLTASTEYELVVDGTITFGTEGELDFRGRTPYAGFRSIGPAAPTLVRVGNPSVGFDEKINRNNMASLRLRVTTPADAEVGDVCVARVYGFDKETATTGDLRFFEAKTTLATAGQQDVDVDFTGVFGTLERAKLVDGNVWFVAQMWRGSQHSGAIGHASSAEPRFDVTPPTLVAIGPPGSLPANEIYTDQEALVFYGTASEQVAAATLADGVNPVVELFAAAEDGRFAVKFTPLGRLQAPRSYSLLLTDLAGNLAAAAYTGSIVQRGVVTGTYAGTLVVEAYDHTTLQPIAGATVLVDVDTPTVPATAQSVGTTDATGRATFSGLGGTYRTVTIVRAGYDLVTFADTAAAFVSLPLRPLADATATFTGTLTGVATSATALVGNNTYDDPLVFTAATPTTAPTAIPPTAIVPNRPQVVTAFGGSFEPTAAPDYSTQSFSMLGLTMTVPTPPVAPVAPAGTTTQTLRLLPTAGLTAQIAPTPEKDFALAAGLDLGNLVGGKPTVRALVSMEGFGGQVLAGVGHATLSTGASYAWSATYGTPLTAGLSGYVPSLWACIEARDTGGRISRTRALYFYAVVNQPLIDLAPAPSIPVVQSPVGSSTGSPAVVCDDTLNDAVLGYPALALLEVTARDGNGRQWCVLRMDRDGLGGTDTVQFPDLATANVAGLAAGPWTVRAEGRVLLQLFNGATADDFVLAERRRMEVTYARSAPVTFTIQ
jgi:hypothetical protein